MSKSRTQPWITAKRKTTAEPILTPATRRSVAASIWRHRVSAMARWLHIYLSMVSFVIVLFFAVTGLTLNHANWFSDQATITDYQGKLTPGWVNTSDTAAINKLAIVELLRSRHSVKGAVSDFRIDERECSLSFRGPGYSADAFVERASGTYKLTETRMGVVAILNDLHKGRDTGGNWSLLIDGSAIFMTLISATGLVLLLFLKKRRATGLWLAVLGLLVLYLVYRLSVH